MDPQRIEKASFRVRWSSKSRFSCLAGGQQNRAPNDPKISPKSNQKQLPGPKCRSEALLDFKLNFSTDFEPFLVPKRLPKRHPKSFKNYPPCPRAAQRPPGTPPEASRELFLHHFGPPGAHFRRFQASFSKLARAPPHDRKHCSKSLLKGSFETAAGPMRTTPLAQWPVWGRRPTGDLATETSVSLEAVDGDPESTVTSTASEAQRLP